MDWLSSHWQTLLAIVTPTAAVLLRWGRPIFRALASPVTNGILRERITEYEALADDATENLTIARSELTYWKSNAAFWRGRYEELESAQRQQRYDRTSKRKPPSSRP